MRLIACYSTPKLPAIHGVCTKLLYGTISFHILARTDTRGSVAAAPPATENGSPPLNKCHGKVFEVQVSSAGATRQHNHNRAAAKKLHEKLAGADFGQPWCRMGVEAVDEHSAPITMA